MGAVGRSVQQQNGTYRMPLKGTLAMDFSDPCQQRNKTDSLHFTPNNLTKKDPRSCCDNRGGAFHHRPAINDTLAVTDIVNSSSIEHRGVVNLLDRGLPWSSVYCKFLAHSVS
jgi:hypothetical protein